MNHFKKVREQHKTRLQEPSQGNWNCRFPIQITEEIFKHFLTTFIVERYLRKQEIPMKGRMDRAQPFFRNLASSCYELYQVATPLLYEEIYLSSSDALASLAKAVTKYPHLQPMVRYLHYSNSMFRYGQIKVSHLDACNIERIHLACGNLTSLTVQRPRDNFPSSEGEIIRTTCLGAISLENLTHLEIDLPQGMPFCTEPILSSGLKLPVLRDLIVNVGHCKTSPEHVDTHDVHEHLMQWPRMPALARLCIKNLHVMGGCFSFPEHSNNIHIIELLGGDYSSVKTFFYRDIWRYAKSLESLVITATDVAADEHLPFKLCHFSGLTEPDPDDTHGQGLSGDATPRHECHDNVLVDDFADDVYEQDDSIDTFRDTFRNAFLTESRSENNLSSHGRQDHYSIQRLPSIIFLEILLLSNNHTSITDRRTSVQPHLCSLALVCKTWCLVVTPMLYKEVYLSSSAALSSFTAAVTRYWCLRPIVKTFQYYGIWFKSGRVEMSPTEIQNLEQVYRLCTNLSYRSIKRPPSKTLCCDRAALNAINLSALDVKKLTSLEVQLPEGMPCVSKLIFSGSMSLPSLRELILDVQHREWNRRTGKEHKLEWPYMPRLTRLCIKNWFVAHRRFNLPMLSDELRIVEFLGGSYLNVDDLFRTELRRYANTLESITVTAADIGDIFYHEVLLDDFISLTEICVPVFTFGVTTRFRFPGSLQRFIISGSPETAFKEPWRYCMEPFERRLTEFLEEECSAEYLSHLKHVRVMLDSPWMTYLQPIIKFSRAIKAARERGIKLDFGLIRNEERNPREISTEAEYEHIAAHIAETSQKCFFPSAHRAARANHSLRSSRYRECDGLGPTLGSRV
ncbi:hypothetical protein ACEPAF_1270 [Sanghuangporus sanghuang]